MRAGDCLSLIDTWWAVRVEDGYLELRPRFVTAVPPEARTPIRDPCLTLGIPPDLPLAPATSATPAPPVLRLPAPPSALRRQGLLCRLGLLQGKGL